MHWTVQSKWNHNYKFTYFITFEVWDIWYNISLFLFKVVFEWHPLLTLVVSEVWDHLPLSPDQTSVHRQFLRVTMDTFYWSCVCTVYVQLCVCRGQSGDSVININRRLKLTETHLLKQDEIYTGGYRQDKQMIKIINWCLLWVKYQILTS